MNTLKNHTLMFLFFAFISILGAVLVGFNPAGDEGFIAGIGLISLGGLYMVMETVSFIRA